MASSTKSQKPESSGVNLLITDIVYQKIFDSLDMSMVIEDSQGKVISVNESTCRITGFSREEWIGQHGLKLIIPGDWLHEYRSLQNKHREYNQSEIFLRRKDLTGFWGLLKSYPLKDEQGLSLGRVITINDTTESKKKLNELKQSDERLRFLLDASSEGIVIHEKGIVTDANEAALKMFGFTVEDVIGKSIFEFTPSAEHSRIIESIRKNIPIPTIHEVFDKQGKIRFIEVTGKTLQYHGKEIRVILLRDTTELKEKQIEESRLVSIIEATPFIVAMMDDHGLRYMNQAGRRLLGYDEVEDISSLGVHELMTPSSAEIILEVAIPEAIRTGAWKGQTQFKTKDGKKAISVWQTIIAHTDENSKVVFFSTIAEDITERLKAEKSLMLSQERLRYFMEESSEAILIHDKGPIIDFNSAALRMFGYQEEELRDKSIQNLYDISFHKELKHKFLKRETLREELTGVKKDGTKFDIELYSRPRFYQGLEIRVANITDITSRKAVERALRSSEVRLNAAVEGTHVGIWDWNLVTDKLTFNEAWRKIYGFEQDDLPEFFNDWKSYVHEDDLPEVLSKLRKHLYGETPMFQHIYKARRKSGAYIVIEAKGKLVHDENQMPVRIVGTAVDITERQQMEDAVRKSQAQLTALIENREEAIWSIDRNKRILNFNTPIVEIFKSVYNATFRQGDVITEILPKEAAEIWEGRYERSLAGESYSIVDDLKSADENLFIEYSLNPIRIEDGSVIGVSVLARNITQQKSFEKSLREAKEAAEAANRTKSQFLANMSHEIRTPMNGIIGFADLLLQSRLTPQQREYLDIVRFSADSLLNLINDLLDLSKIESGKLDLLHNEFDLHKLQREVVRSFKVKAKEQNLTIKLQVDKSIPHSLTGDEMRFQQVMVNLIGNAVKFSKNSEIIVRSSIQSQTRSKLVLHTEVIDHGIGIEKEKQKVIFEPFRQIDSPVTRKFGGTGLGLSIAKKLVSMMGGDIEVESEPGKGSKFYFTVRLDIPRQ